MGREIRKVVKGWQHPKWNEENGGQNYEPRYNKYIGTFHPLYDEYFEDEKWTDEEDNCFQLYETELRYIVYCSKTIAPL